jgi:predicted HicB family RNase H-like nuclease
MPRQRNRFLTHKEELRLEDKDRIKQLTLRLPEILHREFKATAAKEGRTMGDVATELIKEYIEKK